MKRNLLVVFIVIICSCSFAQNTADKWEQFHFLTGSWKGEGEGKPGMGEGVFTFEYQLDSAVFVRKSHSECPNQKDKTILKHDDLMIIYAGDSAGSFKANYFDNEGHVIYYNVSFADKNEIVFTSVKSGNTPVFRLSYSLVKAGIVNTKFEISRDGVNFFTYIEGKSKRIL